ncbi:hypothetical protein KJ567_00775 [Candidatus Bipolaricaulota bacterium]|nr:hypothetical protein [Candidatus Bipolaricaulota bacterium]
MGMLHPDQIRDLARQDPLHDGGGPEWNLGYFDTIVNSHFRTLDGGTLVFYPYGAFGRCGYVVESERQEASLRRRARRLGRLSYALYLVAAFVAARFVPQIDWPVFLLIMAIGWVPDWMTARLAFWSLTRRMERATGANSPMAYWRNMGRTMHPALLALFGIFGLLMAAAGFLIYALDRDAIGLLIGAFFALLIFPYALAMWSWWRR